MLKAAWGLAVGGIVGAALASSLASNVAAQDSKAQDLSTQDFMAKCSAAAMGVPAAGRVLTAEFVAAGPVPVGPPAPPTATAPVPAHCLIRGNINERTGIDGKPYAIGYELRLPAAWNGKFFFQGGGGMDGVLRPAFGIIGSGVTPPNALSNGYAVVSTDAVINSISIGSIANTSRPTRSMQLQRQSW